MNVWKNFKNMITEGKNEYSGKQQGRSGTQWKKEHVEK